MIIFLKRNFNMSEHPALVQMQKDKEIFGQEEINKEINRYIGGDKQGD